MTFSRDGRSIAYTLMRPGSSRIETWIGPADGGRGEMIAIDTDGPVWSPDSRALAYAYIRTSGSRIVETRVVVQRLGGAERPISRQLRTGFFFPKYWTNGDHLLGLYNMGTTRRLFQRLGSGVRSRARRASRRAFRRLILRFARPVHLALPGTSRDGRVGASHRVDDENRERECVDARRYRSLRNYEQTKPRPWMPASSHSRNT